MKLWIRSQDKKTLVKSDYITIIWSPFHYSIVGYLNGKIKHKILGSYKTQKRAIEILDEIQNILKPKYILDTSSIKPDGDFYKENGVIFQKYNANARIEELSTFVYQMPEN